MTQDLRNKQLIKNTNWDMWTNPQTVRNTHLWGSVSAARCVRAVEPEKRYCADGDLLDPIWANPRSYTPPDQDTLITNTERERNTEQCEQINCILKCIWSACLYFSPQFLPLSLEAPSLAHRAVWLWMQELLAAINTFTENPLNMQCFKLFFTKEPQIFTLKIPPFCQAIFSMVSPSMLVWSIPNEEMPHTQGRLGKTF